MNGSTTFINENIPIISSKISNNMKIINCEALVLFFTLIKSLNIKLKNFIYNFIIVYLYH